MIRDAVLTIVLCVITFMIGHMVATHRKIDPETKLVVIREIDSSFTVIVGDNWSENLNEYQVDSILISLATDTIR